MVWVDNEDPFKKTGVTMEQISDEAGKHGIAMWAGVLDVRHVFSRHKYLPSLKEYSQ